MVEEIRKHIEQFFKDDRYSYHSLQHTIDVMTAATLIAKKEGLPEESIELLQIAALFHDTGYTQDPENHESVGAQKAKNYLVKHSYPNDKIRIVEQLILATKMEAVPKTDMEAIIKDADMSHLGSDSYFGSIEALRREMSIIQNKNYTDSEWADENLAFLDTQKWHSKGGKKLFNKSKKKNLEALQQRIKLSKKSAQDQIPEKGIETMFRVALRNHNQLSKIADNKANIMLSITAIMLSLILSNLAPKIDTNERLLIPTILIIVVNLVTMFFAIMATRPKVSSAPYSRESFLKNKLNILFFGNFYQMPLDEFEWGMKQLMKDKELLYSSLTKDLYFLGSVLAKKYKFLQYAYAVFMVGLIISTIAFVWAFLI